MKTPIPTSPTVHDITQKVRNALDRSNTLLLEQRKNQVPNQGQANRADNLQQMRAIVVGELNSIGIFPEDAYERLYQYSLENDNLGSMEELIFLEHCLR